VCRAPAGPLFFVRVHGDNLEGARIRRDGILVVDQAVEDTIGRVVLAVIDDVFIVKRLTLRDVQHSLSSEHPEIAPFALQEALGVEIRDVVMWSVLS